MVHPLATCLCRSWSVRGGLVDSPDRPLDRSIDRGGHDVQHLASKLDNLPSLKAADIAELRSLCWFAGFADKLETSSHVHTEAPIHLKSTKRVVQQQVTTTAAIQLIDCDHDA